MTKDLEKLEKIYGSTEAAATALGITPRHLRRIKKGNRATKTLILLTKELLKKAE